ncbi:uncharacterized protein [Solanum tuberosum]|uniref:uncharacterized protein n=1 Tax=Solanum tuberosum TaxID=4113 RepID=UPI00073A529D|nr:PREDICTED: uncharacterized protein LOC107062423 [Solanum tuberosum]
MLGYAKFMKELVAKRLSLEYETMKVPHSCSAIMTNESITKREDPQAFTIPCTIGMLQFAKALCDLGAIINLMPYAIYKQLGLGEPKATTMRILMADRSIKHPVEIVHDILVKVDRFIFSANFVILDCDIDAEISIILGRPFLATWRALVDVESGKLKFRVNDVEVTFNIFQGYEEVVATLSRLGVYSRNPIKLDIDLKNRKRPPAKPSTEEPPNLELKALPSHLKYAFLGANNTLTVIITADLLERQIQLDSECKPSVEHQWILNPPMQEVVKKEIIKWLDAGVIYPITDISFLGTRCRKRGRRFDKAKIEVIEKLPPPILVKGVRNLLGQAGFYRRFIKDFSKIAHPLCKLLEKEVKFYFDDACMTAFKCLKEKLVSTPFIVSPNWSESFEVMCDGSGMALGVVLGKNYNKLFHPIYYACKTLNSAQQNYMVSEQELLAVVYAFEKLRAYLLGTKVIVHTDHDALHYLMVKKDAKPRLIRWVLLLQEFNFEVKDRKRLQKSSGRLLIEVGRKGRCQA